MVGKTFTYLIGSDASALFFNSRNQDCNAEEVYSKLVTPVFGKGVAYDVPNSVSVLGVVNPCTIQHLHNGAVSCDSLHSFFVYSLALA